MEPRRWKQVLEEKPPPYVDVNEVRSGIELLQALARILKCRPEQVGAKIQALVEEHEQLEARLQRLAQRGAQ